MTKPKRHSFITGASSGLGEELARQFALRGNAVSLFARRKERLDALASGIASAGGEASALSGDVGDSEQVKAAIAQAVARFGPIDRLVLNAGIDGDSAAHNFSAASFEKVQRVNVLGLAYCIENVLPEMLERNAGHIIGISSLSAIRGLPQAAAYCASKSAATAMLESLRIDLQSTNVDVTVIHPGFIRTPMTQDAGFSMPFLMDLEPGVRCIMKSIEKRKTSSYFPWPLALLVKLARLLPDWIYDRILANVR